MSEPGTTLQLGDVQLTPPATVEGVVRDAKGQPAPGVRVLLRDCDPATGRSLTGNVVEVVTDKQGRYRFLAVPPGGAALETAFGPDQRVSPPVTPFTVKAGQKYSFDLKVAR